MNLQTAQRLVRLVREHREATKRVASLERRVLLLLAHDVADEDTALIETTRAALTEALLALIESASVNDLLALRAPQLPGDDDGADDYDPTGCPGCRDCMKGTE
jgi:hypothetical protein